MENTKNIEFSAQDAAESRGFDEYIKHNGTDADQAEHEYIEAERQYILDAWDRFHEWRDHWADDKIFVHVSGPDPDRPSGADMDNHGNIAFVVACVDRGDEDEESPAVSAMVVWVNPEESAPYVIDYEDDNPGILCPAEILGLLSPVPENSSAFMWRELSRRRLVRDSVTWNL